MANKQPQTPSAKKPSAHTPEAKRAARIERNADKKKLRKQKRRTT